MQGTITRQDLNLHPIEHTSFHLLVRPLHRKGDAEFANLLKVNVEEFISFRWMLGTGGLQNRHTSKGAENLQRSAAYLAGGKLLLFHLLIRTFDQVLHQ